jgi:hypothetical protein
MSTLVVAHALRLIVDGGSVTESLQAKIQDLDAISLSGWRWWTRLQSGCAPRCWSVNFMLSFTPGLTIGSPGASYLGHLFKTHSTLSTITVDRAWRPVLTVPAFS